MLMYVHVNNCTEGIKNIKEVVNAKIDSYTNYLEEIEDLEECKFSFIDFALEIRKQMNLLSHPIEELYKFNNDYILNGTNAPSEKIKIEDIEFKKQLLEYCY